MFNKNNLARLVAEFLGAGLLTLVMVSVQRSTIGVPYFVGIAGGLAAALLVMVFGRASGAHLNPAVTLALWTARQVKTVTAVLYIAVQLLGGFLAGQLYQYLINNDLSAVSRTFTGRLMVAEAAGAFLLSLGWAAAVYHNYSDSRKAGLVGGAYVLGIIAASSASVGIVNPAVALGSNAWAWGTYVLGPVLGAVIGVNLYGLVFAPAGATAGAAVSKSATTSAATTVKPAAAKKKPAAKRKAPAKKRTAAKRK